MSATPAERPQGLRVGSVAGAPIYLGWSWFLLAVVIIVMTGNANAELGGTAYVLGAARALALLVAVLVHEVAHALVARARGLQVYRVVANLMGGHTSFDGRTLTPATSALVAAAGPLANLALAAVLYPVAGRLSGYGGWLVDGAIWMNLLLAAFNLVPGLPLDGGAIVEALIWAVTGRRHTGTAVAAWVGRGLAVLVLAVPAYLTFRGGGSSSFGFDLIWGALLAMVLWQGASAALAGARIRQAFHGQTAADFAVPVREGSWSDAAGPSPVVVRDDRGVPSLFWPGEGPGLPVPPPGTPLSALLVRLPDAAVVEVAPDGDPLVVLGTAQQNGSPVLVLTRGGVPWGLTTDATLAHGIQQSRARG